MIETVINAAATTVTTLTTLGANSLHLMAAVTASGILGGVAARKALKRLTGPSVGVPCALLAPAVVLGNITTAATLTSVGIAITLVADYQQKTRR